MVPNKSDISIWGFFSPLIFVRVLCPPCHLTRTGLFCCVKRGEERSSTWVSEKETSYLVQWEEHCVLFYVTPLIRVNSSHTHTHTCLGLFLNGTLFVWLHKMSCLNEIVPKLYHRCYIESVQSASDLRICVWHRFHSDYLLKCQWRCQNMNYFFSILFTCV